MSAAATPKPARRARGATVSGIVVATFGRRHLVELDGGMLLDCVTRARRGDYACGDRVRIAARHGGQGVIEDFEPRSSLLYRSDHVRRKLIAANVSRIVIVVAPVPPPREELVNRCLAAAEQAGLSALIVLNKWDLPQAAGTLAALEPYSRLGYRVQPLSAKHHAAPLRPWLQGQTSVLVGQSGVGKSTLVNALVPRATARVAEISSALSSGRHTTTHARLYHLDEQSHLIDSPGMQEFGLHHLDQEGLEQAFVEFRPLLGQCRFRDCRHLAEPGCAIAESCERGEIEAARLACYRALVAERR